MLRQPPPSPSDIRTPRKDPLLFARSPGILPARSIALLWLLPGVSVYPIVGSLLLLIHLYCPSSASLAFRSRTPLGLPFPTTAIVTADDPSASPLRRTGWCRSHYLPKIKSTVKTRPHQHKNGPREISLASRWSSWRAGRRVAKRQRHKMCLTDVRLILIIVNKMKNENNKGICFLVSCQFKKKMIWQQIYVYVINVI